MRAQFGPEVKAAVKAYMNGDVMPTGNPRLTWLANFAKTVAQKYGQETPMPSMQLCVENVDQAGGCFYGYSCAYTDSISWASPSEPLPMVRDPRQVFDQLFGLGTSATDRAARRAEDKSILDAILGTVGRLKQGLGPSDRQRLEKYLTDVDR